jgi:hypothetical protein
MKNTNLLIATAFSFFSLVASSQKRNDTLKYSIQLPEAWKGNSRLILALTDIIPTVYKELDGKQFCIDCDAYKWVNFYVKEPIIYSVDYSEAIPPSLDPCDIQCRVWHAFESYIDIYHINGTLLKRMVFTDTSERRLLTRTDACAMYYNYDPHAIGNGPYVQIDPAAQKARGTISKLPEILRSEITRKKMAPSNQELWNIFFDAIIDCRKKMNKQ